MANIAPAAASAIQGPGASRSVLPATTFAFHGLGTLKVFCILEHEMIALNSLGGRETASIGFFWGCFGALVSGVLGALLSPPSTPTRTAVYASVVAVLFLATIGTAVLWFLARRERNAMIDAIKSRASTPVTIQAV